MIAFKKTTGEWFKFTNKGNWIISDTPDMESASYHCHYFVNEIMTDLNLKMEDIDCIEFDEYIPEIGFIKNKQILLNL